MPANKGPSTGVIEPSSEKKNEVFRFCCINSEAVIQDQYNRFAPFGLKELCIRWCDVSSNLTRCASVAIILHASSNLGIAVLASFDTSQNCSNAH